MNVTSPTIETPAQPLSPAQWVEQFEAGWRAEHGPDAFAEHFCRLISPDVRLRQPQLPPMRGHAAFRDSFVKPTFGLIPDIHGEVERWAANGDTIYIELTLHGTIGRRKIAFRACDRLSMRDGLAIERESYFDPAPLLGAVLRSPSAWPRFVRVQLGTLSRRRGRG
jgi:SnoaL-like domain